MFTSLALPRAHAPRPSTPRAWMFGADLARDLRRRLLSRSALRGFRAGLTGAALLCAAQAHAAGSSMPWEEPLQRILESIEGPVAKIIAVIIIIVTGLSLAFGDSSGGARKLIQIVFGLSIAFAASSFFLSFFSFGGGALV